MGSNPVKLLTFLMMILALAVLFKDANINAANYKTKSHKSILYCLNFDSTLTETESIWRQRRDSDLSALVNLWLFICLFACLFCFALRSLKGITLLTQSMAPLNDSGISLPNHYFLYIFKQEQIVQ